MNKYRELKEIKKGSFLKFTGEAGEVILCPDMGGRVFAELAGISLHRIDLECAARPDRPFNNFGGGNFWPAPEGGRFGFNYRGNEWYVQEAINVLPFGAASQDHLSATIQKKAGLTNRAGTVVEVNMKREFKLSPSLPPLLDKTKLHAVLSYQTVDSFNVLNSVSTDQALIAAWTLEQFDTSEQTVSFCRVKEPTGAINFDFYQHPGPRITYFKQGFAYQTDGGCRGQIGVKTAAGAAFIGFYDLSKKLLCLRENWSKEEGLFFNIADNDQTDGPYSAADNYSIFNSDPDMKAFELETVGSATVENGLLKGSELVSRTTFVLFKNGKDLESLISRILDSTL